MNHTKSCQAHTERVNQAIAEYEAKWPDHCRKCNGAGLLVSYQSVPYGMGSTNMEVDDYCSTCIEEGKCPRCGKTVFSEEDFDGEILSCSQCGWDESVGGCPELDDCGCWELPESLSNHIADNWPTFEELNGE